MPLTSQPPKGRKGRLASPLKTGATIATAICDGLCVAIACGLSVILGAVLAANAVLRYGFGSGLFWSGEFASLLFPWLIMSGVILSYNRDMHLRIEIAGQLLPSYMSKWLWRLIDLMIAAVASFIALTGEQILTISARQNLSTLGVPLSWAYTALPVGFALLALLAFLRGSGLCQPIFDDAAEEEVV